MHPPTCMAHKKTACLLLDFRGTNPSLGGKISQCDWWANTQSFHLLISFFFFLLGVTRKQAPVGFPSTVTNSSVQLPGDFNQHPETLGTELEKAP